MTEFGRGVFAVEPIKKGQTIEVSPALALDVCTTELAPYVFEFTYVTDDGDDGSEYWVGLGHTSMYNHDPDGNAEFEMHDDEERGALIEVVALRDINPGEEIRFDYTGEGLAFDDLDSGLS